jgi:hypothetical protein
MPAEQTQAVTQHMANAGLARSPLAADHTYQLLHANSPSDNWHINCITPYSLSRATGGKRCNSGFCGFGHHFMKRREAVYLRLAVN